jgi:hypothetical protein
MYKDCIKALRDQGQLGSKVYDAFCELSRKKEFSRRNQSVQRSLQSSTEASTWWECFSHKTNKPTCCETLLDQHIIIFDEVGKITESLPTGLVDEVRYILIDILLRSKGLA